MSDSRNIAARMAEAAERLLDTLSTDQRRVAQWEFPSDEERRLWFYTPTDHGGLTIGEMSPAQQQLAMRLLATGLSRAGFVTASTIMGLENVLDELERLARVVRVRSRTRSRALLPARVRYTWRRHLVVAFRRPSYLHSPHGRRRRGAQLHPCFFGADPASSPLLGPHLLRPLAACEDLAFDLLRSLSDEQRSVAVLSPVPPVDLVGANRTVLSEGDGPKRLTKIWRNELTGELHDMLERLQDAQETKLGLTPAHIEAVRFTTVPKGLAAAAMSASQHAMLQALLEAYVRCLPDHLADREMAKITGPSFPSLRLAWAGSNEPGRPHYYRIQGQRLLVEYDNTTRDGNHVHTVWRDPVADFGADALSAHRRHAH